MIKQNYAMEFLAKSSNVPQSSADFKKSDNSDKAGFPQFKDILSSTMGKPQIKTHGTEIILNHNNIQKSSVSDKNTGLDNSK
ncbi:MAG: hypothetical protein N3D84_03515, partial [Candidatus Woesearchaeota archaeon]|nr:hypothetical protein [Candidatus Woesearchaeota archaeon]